MKLTDIIRQRLALLLVAAMGFACFSCSEDVSERADEPVLPQNKSIAVTVATKDIATRAMGTFTADALPNELIHSCFVVFVNADGTVAEVVDLPSSAGVPSQEFNVVLKQGKYDVYAFANILKTSLSSLKVTKGETFGNIAAATYDVNAKTLTASDNIPMSGFLNNMEVAANGTVKIGDIPKNEVTIQVTRMVGKLEFQFTNASTSDITVTEVSFKPTAKGEVKLLPGGGISAGESEEDGVKKNPNLALSTDEDNKTKSFAFYIREVKSDHPTGNFPITIKYKKGASGTEETLTALLYDLTQIYRNDWIRVPITLTDYKLTLDVEFYPPIGGFPAVISEEKEDEYYVTFGTGGWFGIDVVAVNKADDTPKKAEIIGVDYDENASTFFRKNPTVESSGELTGEINFDLTSGANSVVTIKVKVIDGTVEKEFKRKLHFIYK